MALAATWRPRGRLRSVMASTTLGLDMADTFTSSDTCHRQTDDSCALRLPCGGCGVLGGRRPPPHPEDWPLDRPHQPPARTAGGTHGGEGHELQDAAAAALLQAAHALLHEPLHELRVRAGGPRAQDGGDEQEQVGCVGKGKSSVRRSGAGQTPGGGAEKGRESSAKRAPQSGGDTKRKHTRKTGGESEETVHCLGEAGAPASGGMGPGGETWQRGRGTKKPLLADEG